MAEKFKQIVITIMFLCIIGVALNQIFFDDSVVSWITKVYDENTGLTFYKYNFHGYLQNIAYNIQKTPVIIIDKPDLQWDNTETLSAVVNNLKIFVDYIIFVINILLWPLRFGGYVTTNLWTILGVTPTENNATWILRFSIWLRDTTIPYI